MNDPRAEKEANYFAMCLLIPESFLLADLEKAEYAPPYDCEDEPKIHALAKRYQVTEQMMILRLFDLGVIKGY